MWQRALSSNTFGFVVSLVASLALVVVLEPRDVIIAFIVLGQAHFVLAYLYQFRAGKIGATYLKLYSIAAVFLIAALMYLPHIGDWSLVIAGTIFAAHFFFDEFFICQLELTWARKLLGGTFIALYGAVLLQAAFGTMFPSLMVAFLLLCGVPALVLMARSGVSTAEIFVLACIAVLAFMLIIPWIIPIAVALGFIILFHVFRWYFFYLSKLLNASDPARLRRYLLDVFLSNVAIGGAYVVSLYLMPGNVLQYLFAPVYYYAWSILHVLFSIRLPKRSTSARA